MSDHIILGTNKGTILLDLVGGRWKSRPVAHAGIGVSYVARDPRTGLLWASLMHGQWGPKLSRSSDDGKTWEDAPQIKYPEGTRYIDGYETQDGQAGSNEGSAGGSDADKPKKPKFKPGKLIMIWTIQFGGEDQPGRIYAGTIPGGLFVSNDGGESFELNMPLWNHESRGGDVSKGDGTGASHWFGGGAQVWGEGGPGIHSVIVDPRNSKRVQIGISCAGVLETNDDGKTWHGRNKGLLATFLPKPDAEWGHDPHFMMASKANPDHLWQQNHCGVFCSFDGGKNWQPVSKEGNLVHFGFPVAVDEKDGKTAWVVPGIADDKRMAKGSLAVARTQDGGQSWEELREGLPQEHSYDVVYRHALDISGNRLAFGSTTGNLYVSDDRGESWHNIGNNFPPIHSVRFA
jgi:hypothetical protein